MLRRIVSDNEAIILKAERAVIEDLRVLLARLDASEKDLEKLRQAARQLDELFLLVIVGEFNAGKSAFINALLGRRALAEGVTPTTTQIHIVRHGESEHYERHDDDMWIIYQPADWLREINIVDTPGTNAIIQRHQEITEDFVPRSDLVLFVTSADRPFSESERAFLEQVRTWGKKIVVVINKIDLLTTDDELNQVVDFVRDNATKLLGIEPQVFPVSARQALQAKEAANGRVDGLLWEQSKFEPLERFLLQTLDERERLRLKLENPLGVGERLASAYAEIIANRLNLLGEDLGTIETIEKHLRVYEEDMHHHFRGHLARIDNTLFEMQQRGEDFFEETLRITRIFDLINSERVRGEFERRVVANTVQEIESGVQELIDWMVERDFRQWQAVMEYLQRRAGQSTSGSGQPRPQDRMIGQVGAQFDYNRRALLDSVGRAARDVVASYDKDKEARQLASSVQMALAQTALVEVGAIGLGALLVTMLSTTIADITGVLAAGTVAAMGLYVIPMRRRKARQQLREKVNDLRDRLAKALGRQFERELQRSLQRMRESISPYVRFVQTEQTKLLSLQEELQKTQKTLRDLRQQIATL